MLHSLFFKNLWLLLVSIILILSGIYVLFNPLNALIASTLFVGLLFVFIGTGYLLSFRQGDSYAILALGILDIFIGLLFLTNIGLSAATLPIIFALWILFNGIVQLAMGLELRHSVDIPYKAMISAGILGIIFSILIFIYPAVGAIAITVLLGLYLVGYGLFELVRFVKLSKQQPSI